MNETERTERIVKQQKLVRQLRELRRDIFPDLVTAFLEVAGISVQEFVLPITMYQDEISEAIEDTSNALSRVVAANDTLLLAIDAWIKGAYARLDFETMQEEGIAPLQGKIKKMRKVLIASLMML